MYSLHSCFSMCVYSSLSHPMCITYFHHVCMYSPLLSYLVGVCAFPTLSPYHECEFPILSSFCVSIKLSPSCVCAVILLCVHSSHFPPFECFCAFPRLSLCCVCIPYTFTLPCLFLPCLCSFPTLSFSCHLCVHSCTITLPWLYAFSTRILP